MLHFQVFNVYRFCCEQKFKQQLNLAVTEGLKSRSDWSSNSKITLKKAKKFRIKNEFMGNPNYCVSHDERFTRNESMVLYTGILNHSDFYWRQTTYYVVRDFDPTFVKELCINTYCLNELFRLVSRFMPQIPQFTIGNLEFMLFWSKHPIIYSTRSVNPHFSAKM